MRLTGLIVMAVAMAGAAGFLFSPGTAHAQPVDKERPAVSDNAKAEGGFSELVCRGSGCSTCGYVEMGKSFSVNLLTYGGGGAAAVFLGALIYLLIGVFTGRPDRVELAKKFFRPAAAGMFVSVTVWLAVSAMGMALGYGGIFDPVIC